MSSINEWSADEGEYNAIPEPMIQGQMLRSWGHALGAIIDAGKKVRIPFTTVELELAQSGRHQIGNPLSDGAIIEPKSFRIRL